MRKRVGLSPVADAMLAWRTSRGLTQLQAANLLATAWNNWARWERGHTWPDGHWRRRINRLIVQTTEDADVRHAGVLAGELSDYRRLLALTQREASEAFGCSLRTWQRWENGSVQPIGVYRSRVHRHVDGALRAAGLR